MSTEDQFPVTARAQTSHHPACPNCQRPMSVKQVSPLLFTSNMDEIVYRCEDCGTDTKRTVERR